MSRAAINHYISCPGDRCNQRIPVLFCDVRGLPMEYHACITCGYSRWLSNEPAVATRIDAPNKAYNGWLPVAPSFISKSPSPKQSGAKCECSGAIGLMCSSCNVERLRYSKTRALPRNTAVPDMSPIVFARPPRNTIYPQELSRQNNASIRSKPTSSSPAFQLSITTPILPPAKNITPTPTYTSFNSLHNQLNPSVIPLSSKTPFPVPSSVSRLPASTGKSTPFFLPKSMNSISTHNAKMTPHPAVRLFGTLPLIPVDLEDFRSRPVPWSPSSQCRYSPRSLEPLNFNSSPAPLNPPDSDTQSHHSADPQTRSDDNTSAQTTQHRTLPDTSSVDECTPTSAETADRTAYVKTRRGKRAGVKHRRFQPTTSQEPLVDNRPSSGDIADQARKTRRGKRAGVNIRTARQDTQSDPSLTDGRKPPIGYSNPLRQHANVVRRMSISASQIRSGNALKVH